MPSEPLLGGERWGFAPRLCTGEFSFFEFACVLAHLSTLTFYGGGQNKLAGLLLDFTTLGKDFFGLLQVDTLAKLDNDFAEGFWRVRRLCACVTAVPSDLAVQFGVQKLSNKLEGFTVPVCHGENQLVRLVWWGVHFLGFLGWGFQGFWARNARRSWASLGVA